MLEGCHPGGADSESRPQGGGGGGAAASKTRVLPSRVIPLWGGPGPRGWQWGTEGTHERYNQKVVVMLLQKQ